MKKKNKFMLNLNKSQTIITMILILGIVFLSFNKFWADDLIIEEEINSEIVENDSEIIDEFQEMIDESQEIIDDEILETTEDILETTGEMVETTEDILETTGEMVETTEDILEETNSDVSEMKIPEFSINTSFNESDLNLNLYLNGYSYETIEIIVNKSNISFLDKEPIYLYNNNAFTLVNELDTTSITSNFIEGNFTIFFDNSSFLEGEEIVFSIYLDDLFLCDSTIIKEKKENSIEANIINFSSSTFLENNYVQSQDIILLEYSYIADQDYEVFSLKSEFPNSVVSPTIEEIQNRIFFEAHDTYQKILGDLNEQSVLEVNENIIQWNYTNVKKGDILNGYYYVKINSNNSSDLIFNFYIPGKEIKTTVFISQVEIKPDINFSLVSDKNSIIEGDTVIYDISIQGNENILETVLTTTTTIPEELTIIDVYGVENSEIEISENTILWEYSGELLEEQKVSLFAVCKLEESIETTTLTSTTYYEDAVSMCSIGVETIQEDNLFISYASSDLKYISLVCTSDFTQYGADSVGKVFVGGNFNMYNGFSASSLSGISLSSTELLAFKKNISFAVHGNINASNQWGGSTQLVINNGHIGVSSNSLLNRLTYIYFNGAIGNLNNYNYYSWTKNVWPHNLENEIPSYIDGINTYVSDFIEKATKKNANYSNVKIYNISSNYVKWSDLDSLINSNDYKNNKKVVFVFSGDSITFDSLSFNNIKTSQTAMIFPNTTKIKIMNAGIKSMIYAPNADISGINGHIDGFTFCKSMTGLGSFEYHVGFDFFDWSEPYKGTITVNKTFLSEQAQEKTFYFAIFSKDLNGNYIPYSTVKSIILKNNNTKSIVFTDLYFKETENTTYYVFETDANGTIISDFEDYGYLITNQGMSVVLNKGNQNGTVDILNKKYVGLFQLKILKKSSLNETVLSGAVFSVIKLNEDGTEDMSKKYEIATNQNGSASLSNLELGTYKIIETKAPNGYQLLKKPIIITIDENKIDKDDVFLLEIRNFIKIQMPVTGGTSYLFILFVGILCVGITFIFTFKNKKVFEKK